jgi:hypothetical protein
MESGARSQNKMHRVLPGPDSHGTNLRFVLLLCCSSFYHLSAPDLRNERHSADVLCFTSNLVTRAEFTSWSAVFADLGLTVDYWDIEKVGYILFLCFFFVISLCFVLARRDQQHGRECGLGRPLSRGHSASSALKGPLLVFLFCFMFVFC